MSDSTEHLDPKEATEARLCAYLEGELPASEKAEIERHLAANPQHRKLLVDLAKTREWMQTLPRVPAPPDLAEAFRTAVERKMLLDDSDARPVAGRIGQRAMLAAVVLLTVGLGVLVVMMLKGPKNGGPSSIAIAPPPTAATAPAVTDAATRPVPSAEKASRPRGRSSATWSRKTTLPAVADARPWAGWPAIAVRPSSSRRPDSRTPTTRHPTSGRPTGNRGRASRAIR